MKEEDTKNVRAAAAIPEELYAAMPGDYDFCLAAECPTRERCLRYVVVRHLTFKPRCIPAFHPDSINPKEGGEACPEWRELRIVRYARGFQKALSTLRVENFSEARAALIRLTSRGQYYRHRNGEFSLSPAQQEQYAAVLTRYGADQPIVFDAYEDSLNW